MTNKQLLQKMLLALEAQEFVSSVVKNHDGSGIPLPNDPRYTPLIGEYNGYHAPEQRFEEYAYARRVLRRECLEEARKKGLIV